MLPIAALPLVAGCQDGHDLGAINACDTTIEVAAQDVPNPSTDEIHWKTIAPNESSYLVTAADVSTAYFWIRGVGDEKSAGVEVQMSTLSTPDSGSGFERALVVEGSLCPEDGSPDA
jgi:hypothetical protein